MVRLRALLHPGVLVLLTAAASAVAWALPLGGRKGFEDAETFSLRGGVCLLTWYGSIAASAALGYAVARGSGGPLRRLNEADSGSMYRILSGIAAFGVLITYSAASSNDPSIIIEAFRTQSVNALKASIYESYSLGIFTMRYVAALSGGIAIATVIGRRRLAPLEVLNIVVLIAAAAISARLLLVMGVVIALGIAVQSKPERRLTVPAIAGGAALLFLVLTPLNYSRNAAFYERYYDVTNPFEMNAQEAVSYLGSPFQVSLGVVNHDLEGSPDAADLQKYLLPSYLPTLFPADASSEREYRGIVDIEDSLTTNSALAHLYIAMGFAAFPFVTIVAFLAAFAAGHLSRYENYLRLGAWGLIYAFAELWRAFLFNQGVIHAVVLAPVAAALLLSIVRRAPAAAPGPRAGATGTGALGG